MRAHPKIGARRLPPIKRWTEATFDLGSSLRSPLSLFNISHLLSSLPPISFSFLESSLQRFGFPLPLDEHKTVPPPDLFLRLSRLFFPLLPFLPIFSAIYFSNTLRRTGIFASSSGSSITGNFPSSLPPQTPLFSFFLFVQSSAHFRPQERFPPHFLARDASLLSFSVSARVTVFFTCALTLLPRSLMRSRRAQGEEQPFPKARRTSDLSFHSPFQLSPVPLTCVSFLCQSFSFVV